MKMRNKILWGMGLVVLLFGSCLSLRYIKQQVITKRDITSPDLLIQREQIKKLDEYYSKNLKRWFLVTWVYRNKNRGIYIGYYSRAEGHNDRRFFHYEDKQTSLLSKDNLDDLKKECKEFLNRNEVKDKKIEKVLGKIEDNWNLQASKRF